jgi:hypothetical protein
MDVTLWNMCCKSFESVTPSCQYTLTKSILYVVMLHIETLELQKLRESVHLPVQHFMIGK